jgi:hypothetical protein
VRESACGRTSQRAGKVAAFANANDCCPFCGSLPNEALNLSRRFAARRLTPVRYTARNIAGPRSRTPKKEDSKARPNSMAR